MAAETSPRMAKSVRLVQASPGAPVEIYIDGERFPYFTANVEKTVALARKELPRVTLTLVAESVEVLATTSVAVSP